MSRDFACLFEDVRTESQSSWQQALAATNAFGAIYSGHATRMSREAASANWQLTTVSSAATSNAEIEQLLARWGGLALELESRYGPMKLMHWQEADAVGGLALFLGSTFFDCIAEDADSREVFECVAIEIATAVGSALAVLVGDPTFRSWSPSDLRRSLGRPPTATCEPLVYWAAARAEVTRGMEVPAHASWIVNAVDGYFTFQSPVLDPADDA